MKLPSRGYSDGFQSFDLTISMPAYPIYEVELFVAPWGWQIVDILGCPRNDVLIGRDFMKDKLLVANWESKGFGICQGAMMHRPLRVLFSRFRKPRP
jgi:hypothetical protein